MKNARIHLIYLAIIGFLAYQYWTKTQALNEAVGSIEQFDKLLKANNEVVDKTEIMIKNEIDKQVKAYSNSINRSFLAKATNIVSVSSPMRFWLEKQILEFTNISGGFDKKDSSLLANRLSKNASEQFFSNLKIKEIRDSLTRFQFFLNDVADTRGLKELQKSYIIPTLLQDEVYWQNLKSKTSADAVAQLRSIQNQLELDKIPYLNYIYNMVGYGGLIFDSFKVAIASNKAALIEGETIKADVYLAAYSSNPGTDVTILVNNREIPLKDGVSHFEKTEQTRGKKTIRAEARIKNPLTGYTTSQIGEFEYEVLPKCAKNCQ